MQKASRLGAVAALWALALPALAGLVHHDGERHAICPEHGELVHVRVLESAPADDDRWGPDAADRTAHEHCELSWSAPADRVLARPVPSGPSSLPGALAAPTAREPRASRPLRYAPKSSPPPASPRV